MAGSPTDTRRDDRAHGWGEGRLATLARIFETFVPGSEGDALRRAQLAAETLHAAADHDELRLLRLALRGLEIPAANALSAGVWGRFSHLDRGRREALLRAWSTSRIARLRTTYQVLKRLALFAAYADEGVGQEPANALWPAIGYRPAERVPAPPNAVQPMEVDRDQRDELRLEADVVVVGSGAGGGVVAARLAGAGLSVIVLEQGPSSSEAQLPRTEASAFRELYLDRGITASSDLAVAILAGSCVGGGTTVNWTTSIEPPESLRAEWASEHGLVGFDGPQTDADLARLRVELGLQLPTVVPPKDQLILDGAAALGWEAAPTERNAGPCTDCGSCGFGCRRGTKRSGTRAHLAQATARGARVIARARVDAVNIGGDGAQGVSGSLLPSRDGGRLRRFRVVARSVVVAGGALRTPLLLQRSGIPHPVLGSFLRLHPVVAVAARLPTPVEMWLGPTQAARSLQHFGRTGGRDHAGFVIESAPAHPGLIASALPWDNGEAAAAVMGEIGRYAPLIGIVDDSGWGRVAWSRGGHPRITYKLGRDDAGVARRALVELARLGRAGGADRILALTTPAMAWDEGEGQVGFETLLRRLSTASTAANRITLFSAHQMGSARGGADPRDHPVDPFGRVRSDGSGRIVRRLHVADASLFPTASGVNPMLTVMLLAERAARAVLDDFSR
jgi:choline dehydrogenase-like flavoprotein